MSFGSRVTKDNVKTTSDPLTCAFAKTEKKNKYSYAYELELQNGAKSKSLQ